MVGGVGLLGLRLCCFGLGVIDGFGFCYGYLIGLWRWGWVIWMWIIMLWVMVCLFWLGVFGLLVVCLFVWIGLGLGWGWVLFGWWIIVVVVGGFGVLYKFTVDLGLFF